MTQGLRAVHAGSGHIGVLAVSPGRRAAPGQATRNGPRSVGVDIVFGSMQATARAPLGRAFVDVRSMMRAMAFIPVLPDGRWSVWASPPAPDGLADGAQLGTGLRRGFEQECLGTPLTRY